MSQRSEHRSGNPHRLTRTEYSLCKPKGSGSDGNAMMSRGFDMRVTEGMTDPLSRTWPKMNEKEVLRGLNERFAGFIEKVRHLEQQNHLLEREIGEMKERVKTPSALEQVYGPELEELRKLVHDIMRQKHQIEVDHVNLEEELFNLREKYAKETRNRSDTDSNILALKKEINDAYQAKLQLDLKAQSLVDEIHFLKKNHEAEVSEMIAQIQEAQVGARAHEFGKPELTAALRDIRAQLEGHAVSDLEQAGKTFRTQFAKLTEAAETKREALKVTQQEILEYRRRLQAKSIELEGAKGTREALENQLHEVEDRHKEEMFHYQGIIKQLENELINAKFDMSGHLREYQDLLNVKMALDVEILSYRKLLEGEECRLSTMPDTQISMPYIYRQSPVYTLPCLSRPGGSSRRAEPQYKFVEEIITETTREIEMSEFEESGSEENVGGAGDEGCVQSERGSSGEGENEEGDKDSPDRDGDQVCDSQQDQVDPAETTERDEDEDGDEDEGRSLGEKEEVCDDTNAQEETEVVEQAADEEDTDTDHKNKEIHLDVATGSGGSEKYEPVVDNMKGEKDVEGKMVVQKDVSSKPQESKPGVSKENETPKELQKADSGDTRQDGGVKETKKTDLKATVATVRGSEPEGGNSTLQSKDTEESPESNGALKVQDEALSLPSKTVGKTIDFPAELQNKLSKEKPLETQVEETDSQAPKSEKETGPTEPRVINKVDTIKVSAEDKATNGVEVVIGDDSKEKEEESGQSIKSHLTAVKGEMSDREDKTKTAVAHLVPEKKLAAEKADLQQVVLDSSNNWEKSSMSKEPEKIKGAHNETDKLEDVKGGNSVKAIDTQPNGRSEQGEAAKSKTPPENDVPTLTVKGKTADARISVGEELKLENGTSNAAESSGDQKNKIIKVVAEVESKTSV